MKMILYKFISIVTRLRSGSNTLFRSEPALTNVDTSLLILKLSFSSTSILSSSSFSSTLLGIDLTASSLTEGKFWTLEGGSFLSVGRANDLSLSIASCMSVSLILCVCCIILNGVLSCNSQTVRTDRPAL